LPGRLLDNRRDVLVRVVEHLPEHEHGALDWRQRLQHHEERHRQRFGVLQPALRVGLSLVDDRLW